jgi:hypothetical protein
MQSPPPPLSHSAARLRRMRPEAPRWAFAGLAVPAAALLCLVLLAGCGGSSSSPGVANVGTTGRSTTPSGGSSGGTPESGETSAAQQQRLVKFSQCMRTHGEPEFPEPNSEGGIAIHNQNGKGINPESPQFQAAEKACKQYAPERHAPSPAQQAKLQEQALKFSECMRHHGVPNFPTPQFPSGGTVRLKVKAGKGTGIEPNSPQFQAAQKACQGDAPLGKGLKGGPGGPAPVHAGGGSSQSVQSIGP